MNIKSSFISFISLVSLFLVFLPFTVSASPTRISLGLEGEPLYGDAYIGSVTPDGTEVLFQKSYPSALFLRTTTSSTTQELVRDPSLSGAVLSANGNIVVYQLNAGSTLNLYAYDLTTHTTELVTQSASVQAPVVSADGSFIAYLSGDYRTVRGYTRETKQSEVLFTSTNGVDSFTMTPDAREFFFTTDYKTWVYNRDTHLVSRAVPTDAVTNPGPVAVSDDGRYLSFAAWEWVNGSQQKFLYYYDRITQGLEQIGATSLYPAMSADGRFVVYPGNNALYAFDHTTASTSLIYAGNEYLKFVPISGNGTYIFLNNIRTALLPEDTNNSGDIYRLDNPFVVVPESTTPLLRLNGEPTTTVEFGSVFIDPGATASDIIDGNLTSHIVTTGSVDTHHLGTSTLTYTVTNSAGLSASTTRTVVVVCTFNCYDNVMFLPGIEGSRLYDAGETVWLPADDAEAEHLRMNADGTSANQFIDTYDVIDTANAGQGYHNVYKKLLADMEQWQTDYGIIATTTPYDWRLSFNDVVTNGKKLSNGHISYIQSPDVGHDPYLLETLKQLAASSKTGKVTIVAHSMGGLVAKQLMLTLGSTTTAQYIDKVIFVATPQLGTPKAVGGLLHGFDTGIIYAVSPEKMRDLAQNTPSAYSLLPSNKYFSQIADPVISVDSESLPEWASTYGSTVSTIGTLRTFMTDSVNGRETPVYDDLALPQEVSVDLFERAVTTHNALDYWTPPESVEVYSIAGWGNETVSGIRYEKLPYMECMVAANTPGFLMSRDCSMTTRISFTPETVIDGDGTVVDPSAQWLYGAGGRKYWVDLDEYNGIIFDTPGLDQFRTGHADFFEVSQLRDLIEGMIKYGMNAPLPSSYVTVVKPTSTSTNRLHFTLHSPLTLGFTDMQGRYTGMTEDGATSTIPGVTYERFGEIQWLSVPKDLAGTIVMHGAGEGSFTLGIEEQQGNTVTATTTFAAIPSATSTVATFTVDPTQSSTHTGVLNIDFNGDTIVDTTLTAKKGEIVLPPLDTTPPEAVIGFSTSTKHIAISGNDDHSAVIIATTSTSTSITDAAGNSLTLTTSGARELPYLSTLVIPSFSYSTGSTTNATTTMRYFHLMNARTGTYALFISHITTPTDRALAVYVAPRNKTYLFDSTPQDDDALLSTQQARLLLRKKRRTYNGLYIPRVSTEKGKVIIR